MSKLGLALLLSQLHLKEMHVVLMYMFSFFVSFRAMEETEEKVSNVEDVEKIRLSRHKMEK